MNNSLKISIVTPVFNGSRFIRQTIESVLSQNYPNLEYWIIDGGSTDGTLDIVKEYSDRLNFISEPDKGIYNALNKGFSLSTGEIMCWLNADDLYHPGALKKVEQLFTELPDVEWITGNPTTFDQFGDCVEVIPQRRWSAYQYFSGDYFTIQQESVFWRRSLWERSGPYICESCGLAGDFELWLRFFKNGAQLYSTRLLLGGFRRHSFGQLSDQISRYASDVKKIYADLKLSAEQQKKLLEIKKLEKFGMRIPIWRGLMKLPAKHKKLLDFPPEILFDPYSGKFVLKP